MTSLSGDRIKLIKSNKSISWRKLIMKSDLFPNIRKPWNLTFWKPSNFLPLHFIKLNQDIFVLCILLCTKEAFLFLILKPATSLFNLKLISFINAEIRILNNWPHGLHSLCLIIELLQSHWKDVSVNFIKTKLIE